MEAYDFLHEWVKPIIKGDYQDFSSKKVEGYSFFVSEYKKPHVQAMVRADILELLQNIEVKYSEVTKGEANLYRSQISRWYVNGFTDMYNGCRRNDLKQPLENHDYLTQANKFKPAEDLNSGNWNKDKFRRYTINIGRYEGILFYVAERETILPIDKKGEKNDSLASEEIKEKKTANPDIQDERPVVNTENCDSTGMPPANQISTSNNKGRKPAFSNLSNPTLAGIVTDNTHLPQLGQEISLLVVSVIDSESRSDKVVALTIALEICELIPDLDEKKSAYFKILQKETGISFVLKTFNNKYNLFCDKEHNYKERAKACSNHDGPQTDLNLIIDYKNRFQEIKLKYQKKG